MSNQDKYQERATRIAKAIRCEPVDRMPLIWMGSASAPRQMGLTMTEYVYEPMKGIQAHLDYMDKLGVDGMNTSAWYRPDVGLTSLWLSHIKMPGRELPDDMVWQVEEKELMTVDDYDLILSQGIEAFIGQHLPKVVDMAQFGEGIAQLQEFGPIMIQKQVECGYPSIAGGITTIPFETLCGARSMTPFFMDLYRMPDKLAEVMDAITPFFIGVGLNGVEQSHIKGVWVGGWRSASALLAPKLWDRFVFPYFQTVVNAMAEQDILSVLHLDQDWTRDLERFKELPARKCLLNLDGMTDIRKARKILGDHMAILGDVPAEMLATGTPATVRDYVKNLIEDIGTTGLLLCPGCDAPINAKHENLMAMFDAGREFGHIS